MTGPFQDIHMNCYDWTNTILHTQKHISIVMTGPFEDIPINRYDWTNTRLHTDKYISIVMTGSFHDYTQKNTYQSL